VLAAFCLKTGKSPVLTMWHIPVLMCSTNMAKATGEAARVANQQRAVAQGPRSRKRLERAEFCLGQAVRLWVV
jgi:hypothetical protein